MTVKFSLSISVEPKIIWIPITLSSNKFKHFQIKIQMNFSNNLALLNIVLLKSVSNIPSIFMTLFQSRSNQLNRKTSKKGKISDCNLNNITLIEFYLLIKWRGQCSTFEYVTNKYDSWSFYHKFEKSHHVSSDIKRAHSVSKSGKFID
jgi:hypothetical protein